MIGKDRSRTRTAALRWMRGRNRRTGKASCDHARIGRGWQRRPTPDSRAAGRCCPGMKRTGSSGKCGQSGLNAVTSARDCHYCKPNQATDSRQNIRNTAAQPRRNQLARPPTLKNQTLRSADLQKPSPQKASLPAHWYTESPDPRPQAPRPGKSIASETQTLKHPASTGKRRSATMADKTHVSFVRYISAADRMRLSNPRTSSNR